MAALQTIMLWFNTSKGRAIAALALFIVMELLKRPSVEARWLTTPRRRLAANIILALAPVVPALASGAPIGDVIDTALSAAIGAMGLHIGLKTIVGKGSNSWADAITRFLKGLPSAALALPIVVLALTVTGCGMRTQDVSKLILDVSDAACEQLDDSLQDEPDWMKFTCKAVDAGDKLAPIFMVRVRKEDAPVFAARHRKTAEDPCTKDAEVAP